MRNIFKPLVCFFAAALLLTTCVSAGAIEKTVDLDKMNKELDKSIESLEKDFNIDFPYDPEILAFDRIGVVDEVNQVIKYRMLIKTREGTDLVKEDYHYLPVTVLVRDGLNKDNMKGMFGIFPGQSLSNQGGFYSAEFSDLQGAIDWYFIVEPDRTEVNVPEVHEIGDTPDEIKKDDGIAMTMADDYVEIAASKLLASEVTGIQTKDIDTTFMGHSLGAVQLLWHGWSDYQNTELGRVNHMIFVDTNVKYDSGYDASQAGQLKEYNDMQERFNSGTRASSDMEESIRLATEVKNEGLFAREKFTYAISETHHFMANPPTDDFFYWPSYVSIDDIVNGMVRDDPNEYAIAVPYSPIELDWYITGMRAGEIPTDDLRNVDSAMYMALRGGFGYSGSQYFFDQEKKGFTSMDIYDGGDAGHGFMFNEYSQTNWQNIWSWTAQQG